MLSLNKKKKKKTNRYCDTEKGKEKIKNLQSSGESCDQTFVPEILRYGDRDQLLGSPPTMSAHSTTKPSPPPPYLEVHHMTHLPAATAARSDHNNNNGECGGRLSQAHDPVEMKINDIVGNTISGILYKWVNYGKGWRPQCFVLQDGVLSYFKIHGPR